MIISDKEKSQVNKIISRVRKYLLGQSYVKELEKHPALRDDLVELQSVILKAFGKARVHSPSHREEIRILENMITKRFINFSEYFSLSGGSLPNSISHWLTRISEAVSLVEAIEETSKVVSHEEYNKAIEKIKSLTGKNKELEDLLISISTKTDSLAFSFPDLKALIHRLSISKEIHEEVKTAIQAYKNKDFKGTLRAIGVAGEKLTEDLFTRLFGEPETEKITKWESRLMKIHSHKKKKNPNLHILIAALFLNVKWFRNRADHPMGYRPDQDDVKSAFVSLDLALRKYEDILSG